MEIKPSDAVQKDKWQDMIIDDLLDQKNIMTDRLIILSQLNPEAAQQLQIGLNELESIIQNKLTPTG